MLPSERLALKRQKAKEARKQANLAKVKAFTNFITRKEGRRRKKDRAAAAHYEKLNRELLGDSTEDHPKEKGVRLSPVRLPNSPITRVANVSTSPSSTLSSPFFHEMNFAELQNFTSSRLERAAKAVENLRTEARSSEEELDSEDEGEGEVKRVKKIVQRPKRWLSVLSNSRDRIGIPAARNISMKQVYRVEQKRIMQHFRPHPVYPTSKTIVTKFGHIQDKIHRFEERFVARHQFTQPARPKKLLQLSVKHPIKSSLDIIEGAIRQHKKIATKQLYMKQRRTISDGDVCHAVECDNGDYSKFITDMSWKPNELRRQDLIVDDSSLSNIDASKDNCSTNSCDCYDSLGYENIQSPTHPHLSRFQVAALVFEEEHKRLEMSHKIEDMKSTGEVHEITTKASAKIVPIPLKDKETLSDVCNAPNTQKHNVAIEDKIGQKSKQSSSQTGGGKCDMWICAVCKLTNKGKVTEVQYCPNCASDNPQWIDPDPPLSIEDAVITMPYKYRGGDAIVCYSPDDASLLTKSQLRVTLEDVVGLKAPESEADMIIMLRRVMHNSLIKSGLWDKNGPLNRKNFTGALPYVIDEIANISLINAKQVFKLSIRWVKRALERIGENSQGLSRKKLKRRLIRAMKKHAAALKIQSRYRSFTLKKWFPIDLIWWRARSTHPYFVMQRASVNQKEFDDRVLSNAGATIFNVQVNPDITSKNVNLSDIAWHEQRRDMWHRGRGKGFSKNTKLGKIKSANEIALDMDIDGYAADKKHYNALAATTVNASTKLRRVGHGVPNSRTVTHYGDYHAAQIQRVFRGYLGCNLWHLDVCFRALTTDDADTLQVFFSAGIAVRNSVFASQKIIPKLPDHVAEERNKRLHNINLRCRGPVDLNALDAAGYTLLMRAVQTTALQCVQTLLKWGAEVNSFADPQRQIRGDESVRIQYTAAPERGLSKHGHNLEADDAEAVAEGRLNSQDLVLSGPLGSTALILSTLNNSKRGHDISRVLLEFKADVTLPQYDGKTALHVAAQAGTLVVLTLLVESTFTPPYALHVVDCNGCSPLHLAAERGHHDVVNYISSRPEILERHFVHCANTPAGWRTIPNVNVTIEVAPPQRVGGGYNIDHDIVVDKGYGLNLRNTEGLTPIMEATACGHLSSAQHLIVAGADLNSTNEEGETALMIAIQEGNLKLVKLLLNNGADQESRAYVHNWTEGMVAAALGDFDMLKQLYNADHVKLFREGDRFCDVRRQRVKFMRAWRAATNKPLHEIPSIKERKEVAALMIQDMVRTSMEQAGIWIVPTPFGHVMTVIPTNFGDRLKIEYEDKERTTEENFLMEFQHLDLVTKRRKPKGLDATAVDIYGNTVEDLLIDFHSIDMQRALEVESSSMHRLTKPQIYNEAQKLHNKWNENSSFVAHQVVRDWLIERKTQDWFKGPNGEEGVTSFFNTFVDAQINRLVDNRYGGDVPFEDFIIVFERIKRLLKREKARKRYGRNMRKRKTKHNADLRFKELAFDDAGAGNRYNIEWNRFGCEYSHGPEPRLVVIDGQLVDMNQTYSYNLESLLEELPEVPALQLSYLQWRHKQYEEKWGQIGPPEGCVRVDTNVMCACNVTFI